MAPRFRTYYELRESHFSYSQDILAYLYGTIKLFLVSTNLPGRKDAPISIPPQTTGRNEPD